MAAAGSSAGKRKEEEQGKGSDAKSCVPEALRNAKLPKCCIVIGMAGSGKTTFMQRIHTHVAEHKIPSYMMNLDPAVQHMPFGANIDIRDTINYKQVMEQYGLGPNGAIVTSLNLFATKFHEVMKLVESKQADHDYVFVDTPGQIEVFTWSASGTIVTESLASAFPTCVVYLIDTPRTQSPVTFMSNMLHACSILYKTRLPLVLVFNKVDVVKHDFALEWLADWEALHAAVETEKGYAGSLVRSMALVLEEFYSSLETVGVSAVTGEGMSEFFMAVDKASEEYWEDYRSVLEKRRADKAAEMAEAFEGGKGQLQADLDATDGFKEVDLEEAIAKAKLRQEGLPEGADEEGSGVYPSSSEAGNKDLRTKGFTA